MKKTKKTATKLIAVMLSVLMLMSVIPMQGFAADIAAMQEPVYEEAGETEEAASEEEASEETEAVILAEDTSKREENVKHFRMSDGTIQAAQYAVPVHFEQDGQWVDYDNSLTEVDADAEENEGRSILKNKDLTNQTADYTVRLSKKTNGKKFVRLEKDGYQISWYYQNANKKTAQIEKTEDDGDPTTLENLSTTVRYEDVFKATDLEYIVSSEGLKENLLLQSAKAPAVFTAEYKANGLTPVAVDDKTVELRAEDGTVVYVISAPYIEDASGAVSNGVALSIISVKNNSFTLQLTLDADWLAAEEREFPVLVDPVLETSQSWTDENNIQSAYIASSTPNACYGRGGANYEGSLYVGKTNDRGKTCALLKVPNLPSLTVADKVVHAEMAIFVRACYPELRMDLHRVTTNWSQSTVCWNSGVGFDGTIIDYQIVQYMEQSDTEKDRWQRFEITDLVRGWYSGEVPNYGVFIRSDAESSSSQARAWMMSSGYTTIEKARPILFISYRNMSGYEDYWSYTNITAGRGGVASVNNFNGNLVYSQPVTQDDGGNLMPVSLSLVFNANKSDAPYSNVGSHMQTNFHLYIVAESGQLADNGYKYYLNDADGTKHWFKFENSTSTEGKDEDGLGYKLNVITVGSDTNDKAAKYVITDKDENKMYFNASGRLTQIRNAAGISATVQYETVSGATRIKSVTDGAGRVYTFLYGWSGQPEMVTGVKDPAGRITEIVYNGDFTVNSVKFADGKIVQLLYSSNYLVTEICGIDGTRTKISYDSSAQKRVSQINWGAGDSNLLEKYSFTYKQNSTKITDIQNRSYTYQFNDFGQTTGVVSDTDGSAQFFKLNEGNSTSSTANKLIQESRVLQTVTNYAVNPGFTRGYSDGYVNYIENTANQSVSIDTSRKNLTNSALKIYKAASNTGRVNAVQYVNGLAAGTYTFSAYVNTEGATLTGEAWVLAEVWTTGGGYVSSNWAEHTTKTDGWERKSVTFTVPEGCQVRLVLGFSAGGSGTVWYDDLQIEKGEGMSTYNLVENSGFTNGATQWSSNTTKTSSNGLSGLENCGYTNGDPEDCWKGISQQMLVAGKANDVYSFGAWIKAASVPIDNGTKEDLTNKPAFNLTLHYYDASGIWKGCKSVPINADLKNQWQFVSGEIIIPTDYYKICIEVIYFNNVNKLSVTGAFCYKEQYGQTYDYDKDGNVTSVVDIANTNSTFTYYGNQMAKMLNPSGSEYLYTYDAKKQLTYALSTDGQQYGFTYDDKGNVTKAEITARKPATEIESGKDYLIVNCYSGLAMDSYWAGNVGDITTTYRYTPTNSNQHWKAELVSGTTDVYTLKAVTFDNRYLDVKGGGNGHGTVLEIYTKNTSDAQKFKIVKEKDGTFSLFTACSNYTKLVDGQFGSNDIIQSRTVYQGNPYPNADDPCYGQRWYFYPVEKSEDKTIVTETSYTDSKNFVSSSTDQRGNQTTYSYNEQKGTLTSATDALARTTNYTYDANNNALLSVSSGGMTNSYAYENDRLKTINVNNALQYQFSYDVFGRTTSTKVGNGTDWRTLSSLEYNSAGLLSKQTYGNGDYINFTYDNLDRITQKVYNGDNSKRATYLYGADGSLAQTVDYSVGTRTQFTYDLANRLVSQKEYATTAKNGGTLRSSTDFTYADKTNYLTGVKHYSPLGTQTIGYTYGDINQGQMPDQIYKVSWNGQEKLNYTYDPLGRLTNRNVILSASEESQPQTLSTQYTYVDVGTDKTTTLLKSISTSGYTLNYTYDAVGNITSIYDGSKTISYEYDDLNQLVRVNDEYQNKTYTYEYVNGNITFEHEYLYTTGELPSTPKYSTQYHYNDPVWSDVLTGVTNLSYTANGAATASVYSAEQTSDQTASESLARRMLGDNFACVELSKDSLLNRASSVMQSNIAMMSAADTAVVDGTATILSDEIGNIVNIDGIEFNWQGRQLEGIGENGVSYINYTYNTDGQRVKKSLTDPDTGETTVTEYFYNGSILAGQKTGDDVLVFMYDNNGDVFGFTYNGEPYYYIKNAQNDVVFVVDADGVGVVLYQYDAWGNISHCYKAPGSNIASVNPITYRSYYFDAELGFYYLNTRYYAPMFFRFLNADAVISGSGESVHGYNMFAYCFNNPINLLDQNGNWPKWVETTAKVVAVAAVVVTAVIVASVATAGTGGIALVAASVAFGAACGGLVGGIANERQGGSFLNGWLGGSISGATQSLGSAVGGGVGTIVGGGIGSGLGTAVTKAMDNLEKPKINRISAKEIAVDSLKAAVIGTAMSTLTAGINYGINFSMGPGGYNSWVNQLQDGVGIAPITPAFAQMLSGFYGAVDDAFTYLFSE